MHARYGAGEKVAILSKPDLLLSSGNPEPSENDRQFTKRLKACGEMMGIELLDHLIIGHSSYVSLREEGLWNQ